MSSRKQQPSLPRGVGAPAREPRRVRAPLYTDWRGPEKKRRDNIRSGFDGLAGIVPGMEGRARSEGVVLFGAIDYVRRLMLERRAMIETLEGNGVAVDADLKL